MNSQKTSWQILGLTVLSSLALLTTPKTANANQPPSLQKSDSYQIAQQTDNCREVDVNTSLNVRRQPYAQVIGTLDDEQNVNIIGEPVDGWVRIDSPMNGYVFARYLNYCTGAASPSQSMTETTPTTPGSNEVSSVPGSNCRQVISPNLSVRAKPNGDIVGSLEENQTVYIANEGVNGWVPIEKPMSGFVSSASLGYCFE
ncbi:MULTISPECIES: SH3 domain-containing protein [unclassified Coleofasciculus]|uniref:SH3 domain-containing protein n=1 Tax=unclassified Coleofasciculus TaxID=2692782 RepID=UPI0018818337|nr:MULTISPECIES: SH3 domain-containing protein [unclassified Coleofasciculus]MBE9125006.1 SH3 domain-containing protein [Coleofasciculus sp. LEGE 07081]MBE9147674.1 SH3 domain-containing protein [Coleofasciculus sp. LEGE 07092]